LQQEITSFKVNNGLLTSVGTNTIDEHLSSTQKQTLTVQRFSEEVQALQQDFQSMIARVNNVPTQPFTELDELKKWLNSTSKSTIQRLLNTQGSLSSTDGRRNKQDESFQGVKDVLSEIDFTRLQSLTQGPNSNRQHSNSENKHDTSCTQSHQTFERDYTPIDKDARKAFEKKLFESDISTAINTPIELNKQSSNHRDLDAIVQQNARETNMMSSLDTEKLLQ